MGGKGQVNDSKQARRFGAVLKFYDIFSMLPSVCIVV